MVELVFFSSFFAIAFSALAWSGPAAALVLFRWGGLIILQQLLMTEYLQ
jgi:hypothetical protein